MTQAMRGSGGRVYRAAIGALAGPVLGWLVGASSLAAQTLDVERIGQGQGAGARAAGMGGAFTAVSDDATGATWNPAGLDELEKPSVSVGYGPWSESRWQHPQQVVSPWRVGAHEEKTSSRYFDHAAAAFPFKAGKLSLVALAGYQRVVDLGWERDLTHAYGREDAGTELPNTRSYSSNESGGLDVWSAGLGVRLGRAFSLGVTVERWTGDAISKASVLDEADGSALLTDETVDQSLSGIGARVGLLVKPSPKLRLGAVVRAPFKMSYRRSASSVFQGNVHSVEEELDKDGSFDWPLGGTLGLAYRPRQGLVIAADVSLARWSDAVYAYSYRFEVTTKRSGEPDEHSERSGERRQTWPLFGDPDAADDAGRQSDTLQARLGLEYAIPIREGITLPIRVGGFLDRQIARDAFGDAVRRTGASAGIGVRAPYVALDFAWTYEGGSTPFKAPAEDLKQSSHRLLVSATLRPR